MDRQLMKRVFRAAAAGSLGLMIGSSALAGLHHDEPDREQVNPSCHPTWGYHQTCWRRFRPLPPCDVCHECEFGVTSPACPNGNCQTNPIYQPSTIPLQPAPQEQLPRLQMDPEVSRNYERSMGPVQTQPMAVPQDLSGRYGSATSVPMHTMPTQPQSQPQPQPTTVPQDLSGRYGFSSSAPMHMTPTTPAPASVPQGSSVGGRYQGGPVFSAVPETVPQAQPSAPRPFNASPVPSGSVPAPAGLPPVPGPAPRSSGLYIPAQSHMLPGGGRYGNVSARTTKVPVRAASQSTPARFTPVTAPTSPPTSTRSTVPAAGQTSQRRYPVRPQRVPSQLLAAPLLQRPVSQ